MQHPYKESTLLVELLVQCMFCTSKLTDIRGRNTKEMGSVVYIFIHVTLHFRNTFRLSVVFTVAFFLAVVHRGVAVFGVAIPFKNIGSLNRKSIIAVDRYIHFNCDYNSHMRRVTHVTGCFWLTQFSQNPRML